MRNLGRLLLCVVTALAVAIPAGAQEEEMEEIYEPVLEAQEVYFKCNADKVVVNAPGTYQWDTEAPTTSFTANGGCGQVDSDKLDGDEPTFTGTYTGNLDTLTVRAWVIDAGPVRAGVYEDLYINVDLAVDGRSVIFGEEIHAIPEPSETGLSRLVEFSVTHLGLLAEEDAGEHTVELKLTSAPYLDGDVIGWVMDATEVDSGMEFNPETLSALRVRAF